MLSVAAHQKLTEKAVGECGEWGGLESGRRLARKASPQLRLSPLSCLLPPNFYSTASFERIQHKASTLKAGMGDYRLATPYLLSYNKLFTLASLTEWYLTVLIVIIFSKLSSIFDKFCTHGVLIFVLFAPYARLDNFIVQIYCPLDAHFSLIWDLSLLPFKCNSMGQVTSPQCILVKNVSWSIDSHVNDGIICGTNQKCTTLRTKNQ